MESIRLWQKRTQRPGVEFSSKKSDCSQPKTLTSMCAIKSNLERYFMAHFSFDLPYSSVASHGYRYDLPAIVNGVNNTMLSHSLLQASLFALTSCDFEPLITSFVIKFQRELSFCHLVTCLTSCIFLIFLKNSSSFFDYFPCSYTLLNWNAFSFTFFEDTCEK